MNRDFLQSDKAENTTASAASHKKFIRNEKIDANLVSLGADGKLIYADYDGNGGSVIDFSYAGYKNGNEPIPYVKIVKTIEQGDLSDHTALIQGAIDEISALPYGERGAILLKAGTYTITDKLYIKASGIVLRGEGQGENGTVIYDARTTRVPDSMEIKGRGTYVALEGTKKELASDFTPAGFATLKLTDVDGYNVGDSVVVTCAPNDLWIQTLGMDVIPGENSEQWVASGHVMAYERWVTEVDSANSSITLNTGIPATMDKKYYSVDVQKIVESESRISECGVENIRFVSYYNGEADDEEHAWKAIRLSFCRDCFVRNVTAKHYACSTVAASHGVINLTVEGCSFLEPVSIVSGARRYSFYISRGQYILVKNCYSYDSRHDYVLGSRVCGPNVFVDGVAENANNGSEPHHRWSTGVLWDNIYQIGRDRLGYFLCGNAGNNGSGHGWMGANMVFWNCLSPAIIVGKPQTEQNFAVGVHGIYDVDKTVGMYLYRYGKKFVTPTIETPNYPETLVFTDSPMHGNGYIESPYNPVNPSSLYKAQLSQRLYGDATKKVVPSAPILEYPAPDSKSESRAVVFGGVCDTSAEEVCVYVDGEKNSAVISNDGSGAYSLELNLENGYHEICVTQVIDGVESERNAARTILV